MIFTLRFIQTTFSTVAVTHMLYAFILGSSNLFEHWISGSNWSKMVWLPFNFLISDWSCRKVIGSNLGSENWIFWNPKWSLYDFSGKGIRILDILNHSFISLLISASVFFFYNQRISKKPKNFLLFQFDSPPQICLRIKTMVRT